MRIVENVTDGDLEHLLRCVLQRRSLPDPFLYVGAGGAEEWRALNGSTAFDVASRLTELLRRCAPDIARCCPRAADLLSIGVGEGRKERILLEHLRGRDTRRYVAVDVSAPMVRMAAEGAEGTGVDAVGVVDFCERLQRFRRHARRPTLLCLLGNSFSNYEPEDLLGLLREHLDTFDALLLDCHLLPDSEEGRERWWDRVQRAYGGEENARFNLGPLLRRGLRRDQADFHLDLVTVPTRLGLVLRTRKRIHIREDVDLAFHDGPLSLAGGETISMGFTCKYTRPQVRALLACQGFEVLQEHASDDDELLVLARPTGGGLGS